MSDDRVYRIVDKDDKNINSTVYLNRGNAFGAFNRMSMTKMWPRPSRVQEGVIQWQS